MHVGRESLKSDQLVLGASREKTAHPPEYKAISTRLTISCVSCSSLFRPHRPITPGIITPHNRRYVATLKKTKFREEKKGSQEIEE